MSLVESAHHDRRAVLVSGLGLVAASSMAVTPAAAAPGTNAVGSPRTGAERGAFHVPAGRGRSIWLNGETMTMKATADRTGGSFALVEASVPPAAGPPLHTHADSDEAFYVLSGSLRLTAADRVLTAEAGDFVFVPGGVPHNFKNIGIQTAKLLFMFAPGGPEQYLIEIGQPAVPGVPVPPPAESHADPLAGRWPS